MVTKNKKKIALLGGAFDPIHLGHLDLIDHLIETQKVDEVWIVPTFSKEHKSISTPPTKRVEMIRLALKDMNLENFVKIKYYEIREKKFIQTIDMIKYFSSKYNYDFSFIFGSDYAESILDWKDVDEFKNYVRLFCYPRVDYDIGSKGLKALLKIKAKTIPYQVNVGRSTDIRKGKSLDITSSVSNYIVNNLLYIDMWAENWISNDKTLAHCKRVANIMKQCAKGLNLNASDCYLAGIFHDIGKNWPTSKAIKYLDMKTNLYKKYDEKVWHQFIAAYVVRDDLKIEREDVFEAILNHTSPFKKMNSLSKLLYVADKMDHRKFTSTFLKGEFVKMKRYMKKDIDKAFLISLLKVHNHLLADPNISRTSTDNLRKTYLYYKRLYTDGPNGKTKA